VATTSNVTSGINVSQIVSGLMDIARQPVTKVEAQIEKKTLALTTLGVFKSKVSALETGSKKIQDAWLLTNRTASSNDSSKVSATATSAAREGSYSVKVAQTAQSETVSIPGFTSARQIMDLSAFSLTFGSNTYRPDYVKFTDGTYTSGDVLTMTLKGGTAQTFTVTTQTTDQQVADAINAAVSAGTLTGIYASVNGGGLLLSTTNPIRGLTASSTSALSSSATVSTGLSTTYTVSDFQDMINLLDAGVQASLVQTQDNRYALSIVSKESGAGKTITVSGVNTATTVAQQDSISLSGTYAAGNTISVTMNSVALAYTVTAADVVDGGNTGDDYTRIATNLAAAYNASTNGAHTPVTATASGRTIGFKADTAGVAFTATVAATGSGIATREAVIANLSATDLTAVSFGGATGTVTNDTYTANYDGSTWTVTAAGGTVATLVGTTFQTGAGNTATLTFTGAPKAGDRVSFSVSGVNTFSAATVSEHNTTRLQSGRDAFISVNGLSVKRSSNLITDVIPGVTINLNTPVTPATGEISTLTEADTKYSALAATTLNVAVAAGDSSNEVFRTFVTAFNELVDFYKEQTKAAADPAKRGTLANDPNLRSFMERLKSLYSNGIRLSDGTTLTFGSIGIVLQVDGRLEIDEGDFALAISDGLQSKLNNGVIIGYESATVNFTRYMTDALKKDGIVSSRITNIEDEQDRLQDKIDELNQKLSLVETRYYKQYAALDALLFRLQAVNGALNSALSGLVGYERRN
jgi:flagellar hook-associated protein 2